MIMKDLSPEVGARSFMIMEISSWRGTPARQVGTAGAARPGTRKARQEERR
jgi:hypothetical protein